MVLSRRFDVRVLHADALEKEAMTPELRALLRDLDTALTCWTHQHAPDMCEVERVENFAAYVQEHGGTLACIADLRQRIKAALTK